MRTALLLALAAGTSWTTACQVPGQNDHNLMALHTPEGAHRYSAALVDDFEFVLRSSFANVLESGAGGLEGQEPSKVRNPPLVCLENLAELLALDADDDEVLALQIEWATRLAVEDPAFVVRAAAVEALGPLGRRIDAGLPQAALEGAQASSPEAVAQALAGVVSAARATADREPGAQARLDAALDGLRQLDLDLAGAWRAERLVRTLLRVKDGDELRATQRELQVRLWKRALGAALQDDAHEVRAAALATCLAGDPRLGNTVVWELFRREESALVRASTCRALAERGLPADGEGVARDDWLGLLVQLAVADPEESVAHAAMLCLSRRAGAGFKSLREEDWHAWWTARR
ncbi:MAG: hypothetical protein ACK57N_14515 [Planctomycetia bacterium]|jgi:hypothetical protein